MSDNAKNLDVDPDFRTYERRVRCVAQRIKLKDLALGAPLKIRPTDAADKVAMKNGDWIVKNDDSGPDITDEFEVWTDEEFRATWEGPLEVDREPVEVRIVGKGAAS